MTLEELLQEAKDKGFLVNNLFQLDDGQWQCNLRQEVDNGYYAGGWAIATSPHLALLEALSKPVSFHTQNERQVTLSQTLKRLTLEDIGLKRK
jgi:hypothetical protein